MDDDHDGIELQPGTGSQPGFIERPRPASPVHALGQVGEGARETFDIFLHLRAVAAVLEQIRATPAIEVGGLIVGNVCFDPEGAWLDVAGAIPARQSRASRVSLTFTHEAWDQMLGDMERLHPGQGVLGWYHTHPGLGIFLSAQDLFIHRSFFARPTDVALVIDPRTFSFTPFVWEKEELRPARRFFVYAAEQEFLPEEMLETVLRMLRGSD